MNINDDSNNVYVSGGELKTETKDIIELPEESQVQEKNQ